MIRRNGTYQVDLREAMRGGDGTVKIEHFWDEKNELQGLNRLFARLTLEPGCSIGFHRHEEELEVFVVISGEGEVDDNGAVALVKAGDTIATGFGAGHAVRCTGTEALVMLAVITERSRS